MDSPQKLHLGCYHIIHEGWVNTDVTPQILIARVPGLASLLTKLKLVSPENAARHRQGLFKAAKYLDVTRRFPYNDNTFDYVFTSHMLEHLFPDEAQFCLREVYRVMKPGAVLRIAVPDLEQIVQSFDVQYPEGFLDSMYQGRSAKTQHRARHWWHYTHHSLGRLLEQSGFAHYYRCSFQHGQCADLEKIDNRPLSLFMEAIK